MSLRNGSTESLEYLLRQEGKVKKPKLLKVVKGYTRELRKQSRRDQDKALLETAGQLGTQALRALSNLGSGIAEAHGRAVAAWLGNQDPITWAAGGVAMVAYITWLSTLSNTLAEKLNLPFLANIIPTITTVTRDSIKDIANSTFLGDPTGPPPQPAPPADIPETFGPPYWTVEVTGLTGPSSVRWYDNKAAAEQGWDVLRVGSYLLDAGRLVELWEKRTVWQNGMERGTRGTLLKTTKR